MVVISKVADPETGHLTPAQLGDGLPLNTQQKILRAVANIKYGSVEVVIHDSKVVQIEYREKIRVSNNGSRHGAESC